VRQKFGERPALPKPELWQVAHGVSGRDGRTSQLESAVIGVMDGAAEEIALVNDTGEWVEVRAVIHHAGGASARGSLIDPPDPALHRYVHRLPAWSAGLPLERGQESAAAP